MKKIILVLAFLLIPQICFAADPVLEKLQAIRYKLEIGVTYRDYNTVFEDAYVEYRKADNGKYKKLMQMYADLRILWHDDIFRNKPYYYGPNDFVEDNPICKPYIQQFSPVKSAITCLVTVAPKLENE